MAGGRTFRLAARCFELRLCRVCHTGVKSTWGRTEEKDAAQSGGKSKSGRHKID